MHLEHYKSTILREMLWGGRWGGSCLGTHVRIKDFKIKKKRVYLTPVYFSRRLVFVAMVLPNVKNSYN